MNKCGGFFASQDKAQDYVQLPTFRVVIIALSSCMEQNDDSAIREDRIVKRSQWRSKEHPNEGRLYRFGHRRRSRRQQQFAIQLTQHTKSHQQNIQQ